MGYKQNLSSDKKGLISILFSHASFFFFLAREPNLLRLSSCRAQPQTNTKETQNKAPFIYLPDSSRPLTTRPAFSQSRRPNPLHFLIFRSCCMDVQKCCRARQENLHRDLRRSRINPSQARQKRPFEVQVFCSGAMPTRISGHVRDVLLTRPTGLCADARTRRAAFALHSSAGRHL